MDDLRPELICAPAAIEGLRIARAVLSGEPVPAVTGDLQPVLHALAWLTAGALAGQFTVLGLTEDEARAEAVAFMEDRLAALLLDVQPPAPSDPLLPLGEPHDH